MTHDSNELHTLIPDLRIPASQVMMHSLALQRAVEVLSSRGDMFDHEVIIPHLLTIIEKIDGDIIIGASYKGGKKTHGR